MPQDFSQDRPQLRLQNGPWVQSLHLQLAAFTLAVRLMLRHLQQQQQEFGAASMRYVSKRSFTIMHLAILSLSAIWQLLLSAQHGTGQAFDAASQAQQQAGHIASRSAALQLEVSLDQNLPSEVLQQFHFTVSADAFGELVASKHDAVGQPCVATGL